MRKAIKNTVFDDIPEKIIRAAAAQMSIQARRENFALGIPITILKGQYIVEQYADGSEKILKKIKSGLVKSTKKTFKIGK